MKEKLDIENIVSRQNNNTEYKMKRLSTHKKKRSLRKKIGRSIIGNSADSDGNDNIEWRKKTEKGFNIQGRNKYYVFKNEKKWKRIELENQGHRYHEQADYVFW